MELASHLGMSLARVKQETSSREFVLWMVYLEMKAKAELEHADKHDQYLAQIAYEMRLSWINEEGRNNLELDKFILKFKTGKEKEVQEEESAQSVEERRKVQLAMMKASWGALFSPKKKRPHKDKQWPLKQQNLKDS